MCGIVGYVGKGSCAPVLLDGLRRLEYRGYDSAGIAAVRGAAVAVAKRAGRISALEEALGSYADWGPAGIGHTRWATHGAPTDRNAHPHVDCTGEIALVHNGIIENYRTLRRELEAAGHEIRSETDSELLAHLIEERRRRGDDPVAAVREALQRVQGSYAVAVLFASLPDALIAARNESPLVVGFGDGENFVASDIPAILRRSGRAAVLDDGEMALLRPDCVRFFGPGGAEIEKAAGRIAWEPEQAEKGGYEHFMLKEIHEQPRALRAALSGRLTAGGGVDLSESGLEPGNRFIQEIDQVVLLACGTAHYASRVGKALIERMCALRADAELASEFRYADPLVDGKTLAIVVSQSGETADSLAALREARRRGCKVLGVTNVEGSTLAREADWTLCTRAGPEIAVASTKAYVAQVACLTLVAAALAQLRRLARDRRVEALLTALAQMPERVARVISETAGQARAVAESWRHAQDVFYLGRGLDSVTAMEGALKLKELAYIHAEALAAGELKHGSLALVAEGVPVVAISTQSHLKEKMLSNIEEVKARGAEVLAVVPERGYESYQGAADCMIRLPEAPDALSPLLAVAPLQLIAYYAAVARACDVDRPRNLAKSVTVE